MCFSEHAASYSLRIVECMKRGDADAYNRGWPEGRQPPRVTSEFSSRIQQSLNASIHFFSLHGLAACSLVDADLYLPPEPFVVSEQPCDRFLYKLAAGEPKLFESGMAAPHLTYEATRIWVPCIRRSPNAEI